MGKLVTTFVAAVITLELAFALTAMPAMNGAAQMATAGYGNVSDRTALPASKLAGN
jgi:hypothetical protein